MKANYLKFLCLLMASSLFFGCKSKTTENTKPPTTVPSNQPSDPSTPTVPKPAPGASTDSGINLEQEETILEVPTEEAPRSTSAINKLCGKANFDLNAETNKIAKELSGIDYVVDSAAKADCSGIFHRVLDKFKSVCPDVKLPAFNKARDSRSLAAWYEKNGNLKIVRNPAKEADLIQPGTVMFYGYGKRLHHYDFQKMTMDTLTLRQVGINHIAIVTSVNRVDGELLSYELFHGRSPGKKSDITTSQKVPSSRSRKDLPMYGNWDEPWLAVASPFGI